MIQPSNKVTPFIWFDNQAEAAAELYVSLIPNSRIIEVARWAKGAPFPEGTAMSATFELDGRQFIAFNGGPHHKQSESFSMFVSCEDQAEVDRYWNALIADGGKPGQCAWLKDKFGLSWQIVPKALGRLLGDPDPARAGRAMKAMMGMTKIVVADLEQAAAGQ
ncbi:MAG TPA: VOC family protein [Burkholderiaceae bacterium]|jgi:predicted 3-demethylubiquinone-9 3-methyltransferase (glyoxalase superfamily)